MSAVRAITERLRSDRYQVAAIGVGTFLGLGVLVAPWLPAAIAVVFLVTAVAVARPAWVVPVVFASILAESFGQLDVFVAGVPLTLSKLSVLLAAFVWLVHAVQTRKPLVQWLDVTPGMVAVSATMILSLAVAEEIHVAAGVHPIIGVITLSVLVHLVVQLVPVPDLRTVLRGIAIAALLLIVLTSMSGQAIETAYDDRYAGAFNDPNMWCTTLLLITPITMASVSEEKRIWWAPVLVGLGVLMPVNVFQSLSRAGLLAMIATSPLIFMLAWRRKWWFLIAIVAVVFVAPMFIETEAMADRYTTLIDADAAEGDASLTMRTRLAQTGVEMLKEYWLTGVGGGRFRLEATAYTGGEANLVAHNTYLTFSVEQGIMGILSHGYFFLLIARSIFRSVRQASTRVTKRLAWGYATSAFSFALMSATLDNITFAMGWMMLGIGLVIERATEHTPEELEKWDLA